MAASVTEVGLRVSIGCMSVVVLRIAIVAIEKACRR